jgi:hypothetical protein
MPRPEGQPRPGGAGEGGSGKLPGKEQPFGGGSGGGSWIPKSGQIFPNPLKPPFPKSGQIFPKPGSGQGGSS